MTEMRTAGNDLLRAAARLNRWATRHASFDVPYAQARLLALLDEIGPARISVLAEADHSSQPTLTTQVQRLEAAGWARRESDPADARATLISLTEAGRAALESVRQARYAVLAPVLDQLDEHGRERLHVAVAVLEELVVAMATDRPASRATGPTTPRTTAPTTAPTTPRTTDHPRRED